MRILAFLPLCLPMCLAMAACSSDSASGGGGGAPREGSAREGATPRRDIDMTPRDTKVAGTPGIRVTWEALAYELDVMKRKPRGAQLGFGQVDEVKVVLLNESHPDAAKVTHRTKEAEFAVLSDRDMLDLLQGFEQEGFFQYAQPTASVERLFSSERSRGRITVERGSESVTLLSQRLMGTDPKTRPIVQIYSESKAAISLMKNRTPTMSVKAYGTEPVRPSIPGSR